MSRAGDVVTLARQKGAILAVAESCTGGLLAGAITDIPGSSHVFDRGFVTYSNAAKREMLGVAGRTIDRFGAVSPEVAREMAEGALQRSGATVAIAVTGVAGPGGSEHKPEGRVCFGVAQTGRPTHSETIEFGAAGRGAVRARSVEHALGMLLARLA